MEDVIHYMFFKFPRYVGIRQKLMDNKEDMIHHMKTFSGVDECFTSVYSYFHGKPVIDKVFFDIDHENEEYALLIAKKLFKFMKEYFEIEIIPFCSGKKGFHLYPLFKPKIYNNASELLKKFSYFVINESEAYEYDEKDGKKIPLVDSHVIGDVRRLCRFPNTQRISKSGVPLNSYCIPLHPENFLNLTIDEIKELKKTQQIPKYKFTKPEITLGDLKFRTPNIDEFKASYNKSDIDYDFTFLSPKNIYARILKYSIKKPCIRKYIMTNNPPDIIRVAATIELCNMGFSTKLIIKMYSSLGWHDWNPEYTAYQIESIRSKKLTPIGRKKLTEYGFCNRTEECELWCK